MKGLVEEYGRIIIMVIIATIVFGGVFVGINIWYQDAFPKLSQGNVSVVQGVSSGPVLLVEPLEYKMGTVLTEDILKSEAKGYTDGNLSAEVPVEVLGMQGVDTGRKGIYQIMFIVEDYHEQRFHKLVPVLIY